MRHIDWIRFVTKWPRARIWGMLLLALLTVSLQSCAPGFGMSYPYPKPTEDLSDSRASFLADIESEPGRNFGRFTLGPVTDERNGAAVIIVGGREVSATGDLGDTVGATFRRIAERVGFDFCSPGEECPIIRLSVTGWQAKIESAFPLSTIEAQAAVQVDIVSSLNMPIFAGRYSGSAGVKHPAPGETQVDEVLNLSLGFALSEALKDSSLRAALK